MEKKEAFLCPFCGAPYRELIPVGTVQVKCRYCGATVLVPPRLGGAVQNCPNHPDSLAVGFCNSCKKAFCDKCLHIWRDLYLCPECLKKQYSGMAYALVFAAFGMLIMGWIATNQLLAEYPKADTGGLWAMAIFFFLAFLIAAAFFGATTPSAPTIYEKMKASEVELTKEELYRKLEEAYVKAYGSPSWLEDRINAYVKRGLTREEAIRRVAEDEGYL